jgi:hypothetical protein
MGEPNTSRWLESQYRESCPCGFPRSHIPMGDLCAFRHSPTRQGSGRSGQGRIETRRRMHGTFPDRRSATVSRGQKRASDQLGRRARGIVQAGHAPRLNNAPDMHPQVHPHSQIVPTEASVESAATSATARLSACPALATSRTASVPTREPLGRPTGPARRRRRRFPTTRSPFRR